MKKLMTMIGAMMLSATLFAANDPAFGYQGVLRDERGNPLTDVDKVTIEFRLYYGTEDTDAKWGRRMSVPIDTNGLFNAELADENGSQLLSSKLGDVLRKAEDESKPIYVGLTVEGSSGEIRPRQKLIPVPIAAYAQDVGVAKGDFTVAGQATFKSGIGIERGSLVAPSIEITGETTLGSNVVCGAISTGNATVSGDLAATGKVAAPGGFYLDSACTVSATTPIGAIMMWSGSGSRKSLPPGWYLCEGQVDYWDPYAEEQRTVPDLRGRFIVGVNVDDSEGGHTRATGLSEYRHKQTGGSESVVLKEGEIASHTHGYVADDWMRRKIHSMLVNAGITDQTGAGNQYVMNGSKYLKFDLDSNHNSWDDNKGSDEGDKNATLAYTGKNNLGSNNKAQAAAAHENRPPYYALCYIIFLGNNVR